MEPVSSVVTGYPVKIYRSQTGYWMQVYMGRRNMQLHNFALIIVCSGICVAQQITIPDGTKLRVRLDQPLSSATAEVGQAVELTVAEAVKIDGSVAIKEGSRATGTITEALPKWPMGGLANSISSLTVLPPPTASGSPYVIRSVSVELSRASSWYGEITKIG